MIKESFWEKEMLIMFSFSFKKSIKSTKYYKTQLK